MKPIPTFVINLEKRTERKQHILEQFKNRYEFDIRIFKAIENENGAFGLWQTIVDIVKSITHNQFDPYRPRL